MRICWSFFAIFSRKSFKTKTFVLCLLLFPTLMAFVSIMSLKENSIQPLQVAVYFEKVGEVEKGIAKTLQENKDVDFLIMEGKEETYQSVQNGQVIGAYIFHEDLEENIEGAKFEDIVDIVKLGDNMYLEYINPIVFTATYQYIVPYVSKVQLQKYGVEKDIGTLKKSINAYTEDVQRFGIQIKYTKDNMSANTVEKSFLMTGLMRGSVAIFLILCSLIAIVSVCEMEEALTLFVPYMGQNVIKSYILLPIYTYSTLSAVVAISMVDILIPNVELNLCNEVVMIACYQLLLFVITLVISRYIKKDFIVLSIPFILLGILVTHPVVIDISIYLPKIKHILRLLPSYQYMLFDKSSGIIMVVEIIMVSSLLMIMSQKSKN